MKLMIILMCTLVLSLSASAQSSGTRVLKIKKLQNDPSKIVDNKNVPIVAQKNLPCPAGTVSYQDICKDPAAICTAKNGQKGLLADGKCYPGAK
jgi:hypothetical protein